MNSKTFFSGMIFLGLFFSVLSSVQAADSYRAIVKTTVKIEQKAGESYNDAEERAIKKGEKQLLSKAILSSMRGSRNKILRKNWEAADAEEEVLDNPEVYFIKTKILREKRYKNKIFVKAEIVVDMAAIRDLIEDAAEFVTDELNTVGLVVLYLARAADEEINYAADVDRKNNLKVESSDENGVMIENETSSNKVRVTRHQAEFTTKKFDTTEITTNITAFMNDSGVRTYGVKQFLPLIQDKERLRVALEELELRYAGYRDDNGDYISGDLEEMTGYVQGEIKRLPDHPQFFALGKIDIGNTNLDPQTGQYRTVAKCTMTLWNLDDGFVPVQIATTPIIDGIAFARDIRESRQNAAQNAATETGKQILDRIRQALTE